MVQTYTPDNPVIELAADQDYSGFFGLEIASRKMMHYPPYADLFLFGFSGLQEQRVRQSARRMLELLRDAAMREYSNLPMVALDPTPAAVVKVAGKYRYKMLVKARNTKPMRDLVRKLMHTLNSEPMTRGVTVYVDINPASML